VTQLLHESLAYVSSTRTLGATVYVRHAPR
jgi:hypothetical protein